MTDEAKEAPEPMLLPEVDPSELDQALYEWHQSRLEDAFRAIVEYRRSHADFMTSVAATVLVPICEDCYAYHRKRLGNNAADSWRPPDIGAQTWCSDLENHGVEEEELARIEEGESLEPYCNSCHLSVSYGSENIYIEEVDFDSYFEELSPRDPNRRKPADWMKDLVYRAYEGKCFGCGQPVARKDMSIDHIQPRARGGDTTIANLQLLCSRCDTAVKQSQAPQEVRVVFHFPLVPAPSDGYEGAVW